MRTTTVTCDLCSCVIDERVVVLDLLGGTLPRLRERVDLCEPCSRLFADWLAEGQRTARQPEARTA
jgi:hypothetical protein